MAKELPRLNESTEKVLHDLAILPFASSEEITTIRGHTSAFTVYNALRKLVSEGYADSVQHFPINTMRATNRFSMTGKGVKGLGEILDTEVQSILTRLPCTAEWQREMYKRIDGLALYYGLAVKAAELRPSSLPLTPRFTRSGSIDAFLTGTDGFCMGIMRKGNTLSLREFRKNFWAIAEGKRDVHWQRRGPPLTLVIVSSSFEKNWIAQHITDRYSDRMLAAVATEYEATELPPAALVWRVCKEGANDMSLSDMLQRLPLDATYQPEVTTEYKRNNSPVNCSRLRPTGLKPLHKRILTYPADWHMLTPGQLADFLKMKKTTRFNSHLAELVHWGMVEYQEGGSDIVVADEGLRYLAYRDRTAVGTIRQNWGTDGRQMRKARREHAHTRGVNEFVRRICAEHPGHLEALPAHRASRRYYRSGDRYRFIALTRQYNLNWTATFRPYCWNSSERRRRVQTRSRLSCSYGYGTIHPKTANI